jgi:outer membrane immunogenic protein
MKKLITLSTLFFLVASLTLGQSNESKKENSYSPNLKQLSFGIGTSDYGVPLSVDLRFSIHKDMSIGPVFSYQSYKYRFFTWEWKYTIIGFGGQFTYHFNTLLNMPDKWDIYSTAVLGYYSVKESSDFQEMNNPSGSISGGVGLWINVGGKYFFNDKIGAMLELGRTNLGGGARVGLAIRL